MTPLLYISDKISQRYCWVEINQKMNVICNAIYAMQVAVFVFYYTENICI